MKPETVVALTAAFALGALVMDIVHESCDQARRTAENLSSEEQHRINRLVQWHRQAVGGRP
ncbi:MAG: hypothetical protein DDT20_00833 [Firmicutes bacterium]|nr:hypothetical protein [Bacillota bacterium]